MPSDGRLEGANVLPGGDLAEGNLQSLTGVDVIGVAKAVGGHNRTHRGSIQQGYAAECVARSHAVASTRCAVGHSGCRGLDLGRLATAADPKRPACDDETARQPVVLHEPPNAGPEAAGDARQRVASHDAIGAAGGCGDGEFRGGGLSDRSTNRDAETLVDQNVIGISDAVGLCNGGNCGAIACSNPCESLAAPDDVRASLLWRGSLHCEDADQQDPPDQVQDKEDSHQQTLGLHRYTPWRPGGAKPGGYQDIGPSRGEWNSGSGADHAEQSLLGIRQAYLNESCVAIISTIVHHTPGIVKWIGKCCLIPM
jgi:hypothetical protein